MERTDVEHAQQQEVQRSEVQQDATGEQRLQDQGEKHPSAHLASIPFEELTVGQVLPKLQKPPVEKVQLVKYAGASGDFNMIHTDDETAKKVGLGGVIAHGMLSMGFLGQYAGEIVGTEGFVKDVKVRFAGMVRPGDALVCTGTVMAKDVEHRTVLLAVAAENEAGKPVTSGSITLQYR